ncbi:MAG: GLPGLI family protein [Mediterranea sp.]|jgi:GLPGLI family protein|nr:GLPGLI family protein [Mediterranea sp.]
MKHLLFVISFLCFGISLSAQTLDWSRLKSNVKQDSIPKKILEPAKYIVTYTYRFVKDAKFPNEKKTGITLLQIGDNYSRFCDYYSLRFDSLCDELSRGKISVVESAPLMLATLKKSEFTESILIDRQKNKATIQRTAGMTQKYQYEEACPDLKWELMEGDTLIAGYRCNKAKTSLFGRDYVAWYSAEVEMPYGPYKFNGLPGLVFYVSDTQENFEFALSGLQKADNYIPIYLWSRKDIVKTSRKTVRAIYKNYCADPVSALPNDGSIQISDEAKARVKSRPYNPIELE